MVRRHLLVMVVLLLAACGRSPLERLPQGGESAVAEARSGDTLALRTGEVVRLVGVDAPNRGEPYAQEARAVLERLAAGRTVRLFYGGARKDAYGRTLAHVRIEDGPWLQQALLEAGAAWVRTYPDNRALAAEMLAAEQAARAARRGVWALPPPRVRLPVEVLGQRGFRIVEGRVTVAAPDAVVLDDLVRAEVPGARQADFAGLGLAGFEGRLVRVRGVLGRDHVVRLDHPEQVEALDEG